MKKILILGAGNHQVHIIRQAKKMGLDTLVISPDGDYPGLKIADKIYYEDATDGEKVFEIAHAESVDGIVTDQGEMFVRAQAYAAEKMGLQGIGYERALLFTDKNAQKEKCEMLGLPTIEHGLVKTLSEAKSLFRKINGNAIIKPTDSSGSRGVTKIVTESDLDDNFETTRAFSKDGNVIMERFISGPEFEVDSIVVNGECKYLMHADLTEFQIPNVFACSTILFPSMAENKVIERLIDTNKTTIEGLGLENGLAHAEYIKDDATGNIYLMEAAARGGGLFLSSHIVEMQTGLNTAEFLINLALGNIKELPEFQRELCHCGYVSFYLPVGEVVSVEGLDDALMLPYVTKSLINVKNGMKTTKYTDKRLRNVLFLRAQSREELMSHIEEIRKTVKIKVKTPDGIRGPIWN